MYCLQCGTQLPAGAKFCSACGHKQNANQSASASETPKPVEVIHRIQKESKQVSKTTTVLVLVFAGLLLLLFFGYLQYKDSIANRGGAPSSNPLTPILAQNHDIPIASDTFVLSPGYTQYYSFMVHGRGTLSGTFSARGGIDDQIRVSVTDKQGYDNINSRNRYQAFYDSGDVRGQTLNVNLAPGQYYLVFSNMGSLTNRTINTSVKLIDYY